MDEFQRHHRHAERTRGRKREVWKGIYMAMCVAATAAVRTTTISVGACKIGDTGAP